MLSPKDVGSKYQFFNNPNLGFSLQERIPLKKEGPSLKLTNIIILKCLLKLHFSLKFIKTKDYSQKLINSVEMLYEVHLIFNLLDLGA